MKKLFALLSIVLFFSVIALTESAKANIQPSLIPISYAADINDSYIISISEVMIKNRGAYSVKDSNGNTVYPNYIELYNNSSEAVNLTGWKCCYN